jgi:hypothetical protein
LSKQECEEFGEIPTYLEGTLLPSMCLLEKRRDVMTQIKSERDLTCKELQFFLLIHLDRHFKVEFDL